MNNFKNFKIAFYVKLQYNIIDVRKYNEKNKVQKLLLNLAINCKGGFTF